MGSRQCGGHRGREGFHGLLYVAFEHLNLPAWSLSQRNSGLGGAQAPPKLQVMWVPFLTHPDTQGGESLSLSQRAAL